MALKLMELGDWILIPSCKYTRTPTAFKWKVNRINELRIENIKWMKLFLTLLVFCFLLSKSSSGASGLPALLGGDGLGGE